ncbi:MGMT family protein [Candidatus Dojkabacteria bacterium]|nr:MGMT family protein [Candidatus Dojkabacteria bacterium]
MQTFIEKIYSIASMIPKGKVSTYKQLAQLAGNPRAYRAVGSAMRKNPDTTIVPCHRVVGSDGKMHGYSGGEGIETKIIKLRNEGVKVVNGKVNLDTFLWNKAPEKSL